MRPEETFLQQPIRSLQSMLRVLAEYDNRYLTLIPDGIYGQSTVAAVSNFQRLHGIPVTGITDQYTWDAIAAEYEPALIFIGEAEPLTIILDPNQVIRKGERNPYIPVVQGILFTIAERYGSVSRPGISGIFDEATADSIASFQDLAGLPMTGELDKRTWQQLALHFPLAAKRPGKNQPYQA